MRELALKEMSVVSGGFAAASGAFAAAPGSSTTTQSAPNPGIVVGTTQSAANPGFVVGNLIYGIYVGPPSSTIYGRSSQSPPNYIIFCRANRAARPITAITASIRSSADTISEAMRQHVTVMSIF
jgi:hypothetical protein